MTSKGKKLSNPFSTGNGGGYFESHVQASFVALMLTGGMRHVYLADQSAKLNFRASFLDTVPMI